MIVHDLGDAWQIVLQPDHAQACGDFARTWGNQDFRPPPVLASLAVASERHDDGWLLWEKVPGHDPGTGKPLNFLDIAIPVHLSFWRAATAVVSRQDPYAGVLVGMHGAGIYRGRYGIQPDFKMTFANDVQQEVDSFVKEQEQRYPTFLEEFSVREEQLWTNYRLLQAYDLLSLYFSGQDMAGGLQVGEPGYLTPVPVDFGDGPVHIHVEPVGDSRFQLDPFPFARESEPFEIKRRIIPKQEWENEQHFRTTFMSTPVDHLVVEVIRP